MPLALWENQTLQLGLSVGKLEKCPESNRNETQLFCSLAQLSEVKNMHTSMEEIKENGKIQSVLLI